MYKVYCFLTKNPTKWGLFSRFWTAGNEKPLHSAPHLNRPSHTTVTIKWTFFTSLHNPNSPTITSQHSHSNNTPILHSNSNHNPSLNPPTPHLPLTHITKPLTLRSNLSAISTLSLNSFYFLSSLLSVLSLTHTYSLYILTNHTHRIHI